MRHIACGGCGVVLAVMISALIYMKVKNMECSLDKLVEMKKHEMKETLS